MSILEHLPQPVSAEKIERLCVRLLDMCKEEEANAAEICAAACFIFRAALDSAPDAESRKQLFVTIVEDLSKPSNADA